MQLYKDDLLHPDVSSVHTHWGLSCTWATLQYSTVQRPMLLQDLSILQYCTEACNAHWLVVTTVLYTVQYSVQTSLLLLDLSILFFFFEKFVCVGRVPDPTSHFPPDLILYVNLVAMGPVHLSPVTWPQALQYWYSLTSLMHIVAQLLSREGFLFLPCNN